MSAVALLQRSVLFSISHVNAIFSRYHFVTEKKKMGIASAGIQKGDKPCLIFGTNVPFILRKGKEGYELISENHCHGLMDGEGEQDLEGKSIITTASFMGFVFLFLATSPLNFVP
jgi:hypothetical protein